MPDHSTLSRLKNERWSQSGLFQRLFDEVVRKCAEAGLVSGRHVSVDGSEVRANATMRSLQAIEVPATPRENDEPQPPGDGAAKEPQPKGGWTGHEVRYGNQTHRSTSDPEARLYRKGKAKEAKLSYLMNDLIDTKSRVILSRKVSEAHSSAERRLCIDGTGECAADLLERGVLPHMPLQASLESAARALPGGEAAYCRVVLGAAGPVLADVAAEVKADLLIVGAAGGTRLGRALLGTTAQRVLRASRVPVLVARRPVTAPLRRVLLTTDLSELSGAVHDTALATIATFFGLHAEIRSLMVLGWMGVPAPLTHAALDHAARRELEAFLRARRQVGPRVEPVVRSGFTADEIVGEALDWDADLLVVGTHARGWGARMMLGSVAEAAVRDAPCNVLAIPPMRVALAAAPAEEQPSEALQVAAMAGIAR